MENKRILVIGGTGYIGKRLVEKLVDNNFDVTLLVRKSSFQFKSEQCNYFVGDLLDKQSLVKNITDFDIVINLASVVRTINKNKYNENTAGLKNLIDVLNEKRIKKIIYFSTQNVHFQKKGYYSKSKEICEKLIKDSNLDYIIIRPNYVYGIDKENDFYKMAKIIANFHFIPIIGDGNYKLQPVFKDDLINIVVKCIHKFKSRTIIEVSGNETLSINEIVALIGKDMKINPIAIHIPINFLNLFKIFVPFDIDGFTEDRISKSQLFDSGFSSFSGNLKKILVLTNKNKM